MAIAQFGLLWFAFSRCAYIIYIYVNVERLHIDTVLSSFETMRSSDAG